MNEIVCVGNISTDSINFGGRVIEISGGPVYYISKALADHNFASIIVSRGNAERHGFPDGANLECIQQRGETKVIIYENGYSQRGVLESYAGPIDIALIPPKYLYSDLMIISTILDDIPISMLEKLKENGGKLAVDLQGFLRVMEFPISKVLSLADYVKLSEAELNRLTGKEDFNEGIKEILTYNKNLTLLVTLGSDGAMVAEQRRTYFNGTQKLEGVHTVGAGDLFFGTFMANVYKGEAIITSLEMAQLYVKNRLEERL